MTYRILVTGSRGWRDPAAIRMDLDAEIQRAWDLARRPVVVHGACNPRDPVTGQMIPWAHAERLPPAAQLELAGADWLADRLARQLEPAVTTEPHAADWGRFGRAAGYRRNATMVARGAAACLAFLLPCTAPDCPGRDRPHDSHGAAHCAALAARAGIPVRRRRPAPVKENRR